jgi:hypothetical protein
VMKQRFASPLRMFVPEEGRGRWWEVPEYEPLHLAAMVGEDPAGGKSKIGVRRRREGQGRAVPDSVATTRFDASTVHVPRVIARLRPPQWVTLQAARNAHPTSLLSASRLAPRVALRLDLRHTSGKMEELS